MERGTRPWNSTPSTQPRSRSNVMFLSRPNDTTLQQVVIVILTFLLVSLFFHVLSDGISQDVRLGSVATHFCFPVVLKHVMVFFLVHFSVVLLLRMAYTSGMFAHFSASVLRGRGMPIAVSTMTSSCWLASNNDCWKQRPFNLCASDKRQ